MYKDGFKEREHRLIQGLIFHKHLRTPLKQMNAVLKICISFKWQLIITKKLLPIGNQK